MKLLEKEARELCLAVGMRSSINWDIKKLVKQINAFLAVEHEMNTPEEEQHRELLEMALKSLREKEPIEVEPNPVDTQTNEPAAEKPSRKKRNSTTESKIERDAFGNKVTSSAAAINRVITNEPKTAKQITEESGAGARTTNHLRWLIEHGHIVKTEQGYKLAEKSTENL